MLYEVAIRNVPFEQARALYRFLVNLQDGEPMHGEEGLTWSGIIPGQRVGPLHADGERPPERTVTLNPMPGARDAKPMGVPQ